MSHTLLPNIIEFLTHVDPFDKLPQDCLEKIAGCIKINYLGQGERIAFSTDQEDATSTSFVPAQWSSVNPMGYCVQSWASKIFLASVFCKRKGTVAMLKWRIPQRQWKIAAVFNPPCQAKAHPALLPGICPAFCGTGAGPYPVGIECGVVR